MEELKEIGTEIGKNLELQGHMLEEVEVKMDENIANLKSSSKWCECSRDDVRVIMSFVFSAVCAHESYDQFAQLHAPTDKKLKELIDESGGATKWCPYMICFVVLFALVAYIWKQVDG